MSVSILINTDQLLCRAEKEEKMTAFAQKKCHNDMLSRKQHATMA
jgi:hypothetical protein